MFVYFFFIFSINSSGRRFAYCSPESILWLKFIQTTFWLKFIQIISQKHFVLRHKIELRLYLDTSSAFYYNFSVTFMRFDVIFAMIRSCGFDLWSHVFLDFEKTWDKSSIRILWSLNRKWKFPSDDRFLKDSFVESWWFWKDFASKQKKNVTVSLASDCFTNKLTIPSFQLMY